MDTTEKIIASPWKPRPGDHVRVTRCCEAYSDPGIIGMTGVVTEASDIIGPYYFVRPDREPAVTYIFGADVLEPIYLSGMREQYNRCADARQADRKYIKKLEQALDEKQEEARRREHAFEQQLGEIRAEAIQSLLSTREDAISEVADLLSRWLGATGGINEVHLRDIIASLRAGRIPDRRSGSERRAV